MSKAIRALFIAFVLTLSGAASAGGNKPNFPPGGKEAFTSQLSATQLVLFKLMDLWWNDMVPDGVPSESSGDVIDARLVQALDHIIQNLFTGQIVKAQKTLDAQTLSVSAAQIEDELLRFKFINQDIYTDHYKFINGAITQALNERFAPAPAPIVEIQTTPVAVEVSEQPPANIWFTNGQEIILRLMNLWWEKMVPEGVPTRESGQLPSHELVAEIEARVNLLFEEIAYQPHLPVSETIVRGAVGQIEEILLRHNFINTDIYTEHFEFINSTITKTLRVRFPSKDSCKLLLTDRSFRETRH